MSVVRERMFAISSTGFHLVIFGSGFEAHGERNLWLDRSAPTARFIDVRDRGLPKHEDGRDRCVAQVPSDWAILLFPDGPDSYLQALERERAV